MSGFRHVLYEVRIQSASARKKWKLKFKSFKNLTLDARKKPNICSSRKPRQVHAQGATRVRAQILTYMAAATWQLRPAPLQI